MLSRLHIENVAVIEGADLELDAGLNVLTGETGAGKSIVIDSINMVLGERISKDIVRSGAKKAHVSALFTGVSPAVGQALAQLGFEAEEDGSVLMQREISADGKSSCRVSGRIATVSILREIGRLLVNTHGQHDNQALLSPEKHIGYLDSYAGLEGQREQYAALYREWAGIRSEIEAIGKNDQEKERRLDLLNYQIDEIEKAHLRPGEDEELSARKKMLMNREKIAESVGRAHACLAGAGEGEGAVGLLGEAQESLESVAEFYPDVQNLARRLTDITYEAQDCLDELRAQSDEEPADPGELEEIELRLDTLFRMKKKYGSTIPEILDFCAKCKGEADSLNFSQEKSERLQKRAEALKPQVERAAKELTDARAKAAKEMEKQIKEELVFLDMPGVEFLVSLEAAPELTAGGGDRVEFLISANPGERPKPIAKIASGGELSRIMLAIKNVLADKDDIETSIFDEIDTGVSGRAAHKIGCKLKQVSSGRQVVCVTHLAQIAAQADRHILIEKRFEKSGCAVVTRTELTTLDFEGRKRELARIIGGTEVTVLMLKNAEEMLKTAGIRA